MRPNSFPLSVWGVVWQKADQAPWERYLIRRTNRGQFFSDSPIRVLDHLPVCLHCLSQKTSITTTGELHCHECSVTYALVEEETS